MRHAHMLKAPLLAAERTAFCRSGAADIANTRLTPTWWSQTGSNRRPPACKAGALPAELWPRQDTEEHFRSGDRHLTPSTTPGFDSVDWWAWEDLNLRPHAYQARALTN
jgi:hypothetical protein